MRIALIGAGGFASELSAEIQEMYGYKPKMYVSDKYWKDGLFKLSELDVEKETYLIAIGESDKRYNVFQSIGNDLRVNDLLRISFFDFKSDHAKILGYNSSYLSGSMIMAGCTITENVSIGKHCLININCTIGHDSTIGDFSSLMPQVAISGNVKIGERVYIGASACVKQGITICDDAIIGMGAVVVKDITEKGVYVGNPARKIK